MRVVIPGDEVRTEQHFHAVLVRQLEFGDSYGWNLAALRDRLLTDVPRPIHLIWEDSDASRRALGEESFQSIIDVLQAVDDQDRGFGWDDRFEFTLK